MFDGKGFIPSELVDIKMGDSNMASLQFHRSGIGNRSYVCYFFYLSLLWITSESSQSSESKEKLKKI